MAPRKELIEKSALFLMSETNRRMPQETFADSGLYRARERSHSTCFCSPARRAAEAGRMAPFSCAVKPRIGECLLRHSSIRFGHKKKSRFFNQLFARCHPDLNWRMKVLQTFALPLGYGTIIRNGAVDGARTRDLHLGKVALYQLSYYRIICVPWGGIEPPTRRFSVCCSTD